jgi:peptide/nickel transport system substrate-binding protein
MRRAMKALGAIAACAAMTLGAAACGSAGGGGGDGDVFRLGVLAKVDTLNPFSSVEDFAGDIKHQIYPFLVQFTATGGYEGALARTWSVGDDGRTYTFKLRPGRWSDGKPITSDDVVWTVKTIERFVKGPTGQYASQVATIASISNPDASTVVVRYRTPRSGVLLDMASLPVLPRHVWASRATGDGKALQTYGADGRVPVGGPLRVVHYAKGSTIVLDRNSGFYGTKPKIQRLGISFYSDADALVSALKNGEVDGAMKVPLASIPAVRSSGEVDSSTGLAELVIGINSAPSRAVHPELRDPRVREAFDAALDRENIVRTAYFGYAKPGDSFLPPALKDWHTAVPTESFDLDHANALLDEAGFARGSDGIRRVDGKPMQYTVVEVANPGGGDDAAFQIFKQDFRKIGVVLDLKVQDSTAAFGAIFGKQNDYNGVDLFIATLTGALDPSSTLAYTTCAGLGAYNLTGYCDKRYDALFAKQDAESDPTERAKTVAEMQTMLARARTYLVLAYPDEVSAHSKAWTGVESSPVGWLLNTNTVTTLHKTG